MLRTWFHVLLKKYWLALSILYFLKNIISFFLKKNKEWLGPLNDYMVTCNVKSLTWYELTYMALEVEGLCI